MAQPSDIFNSFPNIEHTIIGRAVSRWDKDKAAYLRGLNTRAKLGALTAYVEEGLHTNVFSHAEEAAKLFAPPVVAEAIIRQNFNAEWLRRLCHATAWVSYLPIIDSSGVYRYFVLRVYSNHPAVRNEARLLYSQDKYNDEVLQTEAAARNASSTTVTQEASPPVRPVDVGYD